MRQNGYHMGSVVRAASTTGQASTPAATGIRGSRMPFDFGFPGARVGHPLGVGRAQIDDQSDHRDRLECDTPDAEPAHLDHACERPAAGAPAGGRGTPEAPRGRLRPAVANRIDPACAASISASASRDLPLPAAPRISTARLPTSTAEACTVRSAITSPAGAG